MRLQERNRLHALTHRSTRIVSIKQHLEAHIQLLTAQIADLAQEIEALLHTVHPWAEAATCLQSIPGIGTNVAAWILTVTLAFSACQSPEEAVAFAGLALHARRSGSSHNATRGVGHGGISVCGGCSTRRP